MNLLINNLEFIKTGQINAETIIDFVNSNNEYVDIYNKTKLDNPYEIKFLKNKTYISDILNHPDMPEELKNDLRKIPDVINMLEKEENEFQKKLDLYEGKIEIIQQENKQEKLYPILDVEESEKLYPVLE